MALVALSLAALVLMWIWTFIQILHSRSERHVNWLVDKIDPYTHYR